MMLFVVDMSPSCIKSKDCVGTSKSHWRSKLGEVWVRNSNECKHGIRRPILFRLCVTPIRR